jgi:phage replication O-like protein O
MIQKGQLKPFQAIGHFTSVPNVVMDIIMRHVDPAPFKVLMAIIRETRGWQQESECLSHKEIAEMTGVTIKGVINSIEKLGSMLRVIKGKPKTPASYGLNPDWEIPASWVPIVNSVQLKHLNSVHMTSKLSSYDGAKTSKLSSLDFIGAKERRSKERKKSTSPSAGPAKAEKKNELDPKIKEVTDLLFRRHREKFIKGRVMTWIGEAQKHHYSVDLIAETLRSFVPHAGEIESWYPYLDKIINRLDKDRNRDIHEAEHERLKSEEAQFAKEWLGDAKAKERAGRHGRPMPGR